MYKKKILYGGIYGRYKRGRPNRGWFYNWNAYGISRAAMPRGIITSILITRYVDLLQACHVLCNVGGPQYISKLIRFLDESFHGSSAVRSPKVFQLALACVLSSHVLILNNCAYNY